MKFGDESDICSRFQKALQLKEDCVIQLGGCWVEDNVQLEQSKK